MVTYLRRLSWRFLAIAVDQIGHCEPATHYMAGWGGDFNENTLTCTFYIHTMPVV